MKSQDLAFIMGKSPHFSTAEQTYSALIEGKKDYQYRFKDNDAISMTDPKNLRYPKKKVKNNNPRQPLEPGTYEIAYSGGNIIRSRDKKGNPGKTYKYIYRGDIWTAYTPGNVSPEGSMIVSDKPWNWVQKIGPAKGRTLKGQIVKMRDMPGFENEEEVERFAKSRGADFKSIDQILSAFLKEKSTSSNSHVEYAKPVVDAEKDTVEAEIGFDKGSLPFSVNDYDDDFTNLVVKDIEGYISRIGKKGGLTIRVNSKGKVSIPRTETNQAYVTAIALGYLGSASKIRATNFGLNLATMGRDFELDDVINGETKLSIALSKVIRQYIWTARKNLDSVRSFGRDRESTNLSKAWLDKIINSIDNDINDVKSSVENTHASINEPTIQELRQERANDWYVKSNPNVRSFIPFLQTVDQAITGEATDEYSYSEYAAETPDRWNYVELRSTTDPKNPSLRKGILIPKNIPDYRYKDIAKRIHAEAGNGFELVGGEKPFDISNWAFYNSQQDNIHKRGTKEHLDFPPLRLELATTSSSEPFVGLTDRYGREDSERQDYLERARHYIKGGRRDIRDPEHFIGSPERAERERQQAVSTGVQLDTTGNEHIYDTYEKEMKGVVSDLTDAADVASFGDAFVKAFPEGIRISDPNSPGSSHFIFDREGILYQIEPTAPDRKEVWKMIPPQIYDTDSPYMTVLKGMSALAKGDIGVIGTPFKTFSGQTLDIIARGKSNLRSFKNDTRFRNWFERIQKRVAHRFEQDPEFKDTLKALTAFPGIVIKSGVASNDKQVRGIASKLLSYAIVGEDSRALDAISRTIGARGTEAYKEAVYNYNNFAQWMRARYHTSTGDQMKMRVPGGFEKRPAEAQIALKEELLSAMRGLQSAEYSLHKVFRKAMPENIRVLDSPGNNMMDEIWKASLLGRSTAFLKRHLYEPMARLFRDTIGRMEGITRTLLSLAWNWKGVLKDSIGDAGAAAWIAAKVFVQHFVSSFIEKHFADRTGVKLATNGGRKTDVNMGIVRKGLKHVMANYAGIEPLSSVKRDELERFLHTKEFDKAVANRNGKAFSIKYRPEFAKSAFINAVTGENLRSITMSVPTTERNKSKKRRPMQRVAVDIPIVDLKAAQILPAVIDELRSEGEPIILSGKNTTQDIPYRTHFWARQMLPMFNINRFNSYFSDVDPTGVSMEDRSPYQTAIYLDAKGVPHVKVTYTFQQMFNRGDYTKAAKVYKNVFGFAKNKKIPKPVEESAKFRLVGKLLGI